MSKANFEQIASKTLEKGVEVWFIQPNQPSERVIGFETSGQDYTFMLSDNREINSRYHEPLEFQVIEKGPIDGFNRSD